MKNQKVAFITGGNRGIGFETAKQLGEKDIFVVIGSRSLQDGQVAFAKLKELGIKGDVIEFDVNKKAHHSKASSYFKTECGRLDILVNNAGVMIEGEPMAATQNPSPVLGVKEEDLRQSMETNFFSVFSLVKELTPLLVKSDAGRIVNLSSFLASLTLQSDPKFPAYAIKTFAYDTSKIALNSLTVHLAYELRDTAVKVNSAHPGWVKTGIGGQSAPMPVDAGAKTSVQLALLPKDGPTGGFFHMGEALPW